VALFVGALFVGALFVGAPLAPEKSGKRPRKLESDLMEAFGNNFHTSLSRLRESLALRPGEGSPRPLPRSTLPLRGRGEMVRMVELFAINS